MKGGGETRWFTHTDMHIIKNTFNLGAKNYLKEDDILTVSGEYHGENFRKGHEFGQHSLSNISNLCTKLGILHNFIRNSLGIDFCL